MSPRARSSGVRTTSARNRWEPSRVSMITSSSGTPSAVAATAAHTSRHTASMCDRPANRMPPARRGRGAATGSMRPLRAAFLASDADLRRHHALRAFPEAHLDDLIRLQFGDGILPQRLHVDEDVRGSLALGQESVSALAVEPLDAGLDPVARGANGGMSPCRRPFGGLDGGRTVDREDLQSLQALRTLHRLADDAGPFQNRVITVPLQAGQVDEYVGKAVLRYDEAVASRHIEPFHESGNFNDLDRRFVGKIGDLLDSVHWSGPLARSSTPNRHTVTARPSPVDSSSPLRKLKHNPVICTARMMGATQKMRRAGTIFVVTMAEKQHREEFRLSNEGERNRRDSNESARSDANPVLAPGRSAAPRAVDDVGDDLDRLGQSRAGPVEELAEIGAEDPGVPHRVQLFPAVDGGTRGRLVERLRKRIA